MALEFISVLFFIASVIVCMLKAKRNSFWITLTLLLSALFLLLSAIWIASNYFTGEGVNDEVIFTITSSLTGVGVGKYVLPALGLFAFILLIFALLSWLILRNKNTNRKISYNFAALFLSLLAIATAPATAQLYRLTSTQYGDDKSDFADNYRDANKTINGSKPNLVYIFGESLERTYFDNNVFPDLVPELGAIKKESIDFSNTIQIPGAENTISGMVSALCGIPLFAPFDNNASSSLSTFYPRSICLGDVLKASGYTNYFYQGANLAFAGKELLLSSHGIDHLYGYEELKPYVKDPNYKNEWGWYDDTTLDFVYNKFVELSKEGKPFSLFALTVDTHHPDGYIDATCNRKDYLYNNKRNQSLSAVACSQEQVAKLINKIKASPYFKNTVIVVSSDHLAMNNTAYSILTRQDRRDLFFILRGTGENNQVIDQKRTTMDNGATVLDVLGGSNFIGLGRSSLSSESLANNYRDIRKHTLRWKQAIIKMWDFPKTISDFALNTDSKMLTFSGVSFKFPLILRVNDGRIDPMFDVYLSDSLEKQLSQLDPNEKFVWVDSCSKMGNIWDPSLQKVNNVCVATGSLNTKPHIVEADRDIYRGKVVFDGLPKLDEDTYHTTVEKLSAVKDVAAAQ
ncbi:MAG: phosphatidylglycerol--membrane-oligosaccharide glycerophosphotransferase [Rouxiella badensis]|uniref:phosphatidylglycerol--membrane-oligosaccharide glycerophosphotransferase n=1 Tax=Rouxiella badensis TaxID=1646377 RepID=UPI003C5A836F